MRGKTVLICSSDDKLRIAASQALERCGCRVVSAVDQWEAEMALTAGGLSLAIVDLATVQGGLDLLETIEAQVLAIALTPGDDLQVLSQLVCTVGVAHVIARPDDSPDGLVELIITASKLLKDDLFGLNKYLRGDEAKLRSATLTCAEDRDVQLCRLSDFLKEHKAPRQAIATITNAADEMLTNAIYNAPVDDAGNPRYAATNRRSKIELAESEFVEFTFGIRKGVFGMSVSDQFGRLRLDHLSQSILRCTTAENPIEQKAGGAGLGLFMLAQTAHQFIVNSSADNRTEVIALWNLDRRKLREQRSHNSLHFFEEAYRLGKPDQRPKRVLGTRSPTSDWDTASSTLQGLGRFGILDSKAEGASRADTHDTQEMTALPDMPRSRRRSR